MRFHHSDHDRSLDRSEPSRLQSAAMAWYPAFLGGYASCCIAQCPGKSIDPKIGGFCPGSTSIGIFRVSDTLACGVSYSSFANMGSVHLTSCSWHRLRPLRTKYLPSSIMEEPGPHRVCLSSLESSGVYSQCSVRHKSRTETGILLTSHKGCDSAVHVR